MDDGKLVKIEFIESYIKHGNGDYQWNDNHGELIRCKDCKHGRICDNPILGEIVDCQNGTPYVHELDWFCANGERR